jgi:hypothetical protein
MAAQLRQQNSGCAGKRSRSCITSGAVDSGESMRDDAPKAFHSGETSPLSLDRWLWDFLQEILGLPK